MSQETLRRELVVLPRCRCRDTSAVWDRCRQLTEAPDAFLCRDCEDEHCPGEPGSPFIVVPLSEGP